MREYHLELFNLIIVANNNINFKTKEKTWSIIWIDFCNVQMKSWFFF